MSHPLIRPRPSLFGEGYSLLTLDLPHCFWALVLLRETNLHDVSGIDAELFQV